MSTEAAGTPERDGYPPISDYGLIGDCRSAALVSRAGSVDWLCLPRFDSPSVFAALLDRESGGRFAVRPAGRFEAERRYLDDTNILETTFATDSGRARVLDLMPAYSEAAKREELWPEYQVLRRVECTAGRVEMEVICDPRPDYGRRTPRPEERGPMGHWWQRGSEVLALRSQLPVAPRDDAPGVSGRETLRAGEKRDLSLIFTDGEPAVIPTFGRDADRKIRYTARWWRAWAASLDYEGSHRDAVVRSALVLKLLTFAPSGAVVAAPTTSLPEWIGGVRNWDYRYCWLRDASMTLEALGDLACGAEADAFLSWMLHTTRRTRPEVQIMYDVHGRPRIPERELDHLEGYRGSSPVRVGNAAAGQLQLDTYGQVISAAYEHLRRGGELPGPSLRLLTDLGKTVCRRWHEPDEGIWEVRSARRHHTHSRVMCWMALDRLLRLHEAGLLEVPTEQFAHHRSAIRREVEERGWNEEIRSYVSVLDGDRVDASLLRLARVGFADPDGDRMRATAARIGERLGRNGLLYRYRDDDGLPGEEGAFGLCSFWQVDCQCRQGELEEAGATFEHLCSFANDLGLFAEEIDPGSGDQLGNFPQAFTHVGLVDAALTLARCRGRDVAPAREPARSGRATPGRDPEAT